LQAKVHAAAFRDGEELSMGLQQRTRTDKPRSKSILKLRRGWDPFIRPSHSPQGARTGKSKINSLLSEFKGGPDDPVSPQGDYLLTRNISTDS
jgi:hypothetical protein